jgi:hypothetical protein
MAEDTPPNNKRAARGSAADRRPPARRRPPGRPDGWRSDQRFHLLLDSIKDYAIIMLDPEGRVQSQIDQAVKNIDQVARQNLIAIRQTEDAAQNLSAPGTRLAGLIGT